MPTFLFKTEPGECSFDSILSAGVSLWDGVTNPAALIALRACRKADEAFIYHTGTQRAIVGLVRITKSAFEDPSRPGRTDRDEPKFAVVECKALKAAPTPLTLAAMKADRRFEGFDLLRLGRLSVMPVPTKIDALIRSLTRL